MNENLERKKFYKFLMCFTNGKPVTESYLKRKFGESLVQEAFEKNYIMIFKKTDFNENVYIITSKGIQLRDY